MQSKQKHKSMGLHKIKQERNKRLIADFKEMTAENRSTKGVVKALSDKYNLCTMGVYRILWDYEQKGGTL